jgi:hypothetical protein
MTLNKDKPWAMLSWPLRATDGKRPNSPGPYDAKHILRPSTIIFCHSPNFLTRETERTSRRLRQSVTAIATVRAVYDLAANS